MRRMACRHTPEVEAVMTIAELRQIRELADAVYIDAKVEDYIVDVVFATREPASYRLEKLANLIEYGASPRASIYLAQTAKVLAFLSGRSYVTPQDVKSVGPDVLRHRVLVSEDNEMHWQAIQASDEPTFEHEGITTDEYYNEYYNQYSEVAA